MSTPAGLGEVGENAHLEAQRFLERFGLNFAGDV
jgi:hypothetical protein